MIGLELPKSLEEMKQQQTAIADAVASGGAELQQPAPVMRLAEYVRGCFNAAADFKQREILPRMLKCQRLKKGEYEPDKLAAIQSQGGSRMFFNITETKCEAFAAWMNEILVPEGERSWGIAPTPIPTLPQDVMQQVVEQTVAEFQKRMAEGVDPNAINPEEVMQYSEQLFDIKLQEAFDAAKKRCERMERKMDDQLFEGGFYDAVSEFIDYEAELPIAILKGPVLRRRETLVWASGPDGKPKSVVNEEVIPTWESVDPYLFYPAPNARDVNDPYCCELIEISLAELASFRGVDGYNTEAIDAVIKNPPSPMWVNGDSERAQLDFRDSSINSGLPTGTVRGVEFWGKAHGMDLQEWGMQVADPNKFYAVCLVLVGTYVIRAVLNPNPLGKAPYFVDAFIRRPKNIYGKSIPEKMVDCQEGSNAAHRTAINNMALCSGPQVAVDVSSLCPGQDATTIIPWKIWQYNGKSAAVRQSAKPLDFFQPESNVEQCLKVAEYFLNQSDERTMIPRYSYGENDVSGAGKTASGLSMLMSSAARSIKRVARSFSRRVLCEAISRLYTHNLMYLDDNDFAMMKGDAKVQPRGILAMMVKEQMMLRQQEFLNITNNPTDLQILGIEGRANVLRQVADGLGMPKDKIVPSEDTLRAKVKMMMQQQMMQGAAGGEDEAEDEPQGGAEQ